MKFLKLIACIIFVLANTIMAWTQAQQDSLIRLSTQSNDTARINIYNELARLNTPDSLTSADRWATRALDQARQFKYTKGLIYALKNKGLIADYRGELSLALQYYDAGILATGQGQVWKKERIDFITNKGVAYYYAGEMGQALRYYIEAEQALADDQQNPTYPKVINNLAAVYRNLERYPEAIQMYKRSLRLKEKTKDSLGIANTLNNIGLCYAYQNNYPLTVKYLEQAQKSYEALGQNSEMLSVNVSLAVALYALGRKNEAKKMMDQALAFPGLKLTVHDFIQAKLLYIKMLFETKKYQQCLQVLQELEPDLINTNFTKSKSIFYEWKAYVLHALNHSNAAYTALFQHKLYQDTLNAETKLSFGKDMEAKYLTKEKEAQIQIQQLQILKNKRERLIYLFALCVLLLILGFAYRLSVQRKRANELLSEKNIQIQEALEDKEDLLKEIHHRVKNNLQIISSLLSLQSRRVEDPKVLEAIQDGQNRVQSMALIHENLYQDANLVKVDAEVYIQQLIKNLMLSYNIQPQRIGLRTQIEPLKLDVDTLIPLGLILNELISNALKYAFAEKDQGELTLHLQQRGNGLLLHVADNGKGMPPDFYAQSSKSLGYRLINSFAKKLNGVLKVWNDQGAHVEIFFPLLKSV